MAVRFRILDLTVATSSASRTFRFDGPVTAVVGPIGTGKSSLFELIKYTLGGNALLMPAVEESVRRVTMRVIIGDGTLELARDIGERVVDVYDVESSYRLTQWATTNRRNMPKASQELLAAVGLPPNIRVPRRRKRPTADTVAVSFFDLYRYVYLTQNEIDISVVGHNDPNLDIKRRAVFELLYGLTSPELIEVVQSRNETIVRQSRLREEAAVIRQFLLNQGEGSKESQEGRLTQELRRREQSLNALRRLKEDSAFQLQDQQTLRARVGDLRRRLMQLELEQESVNAEIEKDRGIIAQLALDEQLLVRQDSATSALSGLEFSVCPRCLQSVDDRDVQVGHCILCLQSEPVRQAVGRTSDSLRRLREQRAETKQLLAEDREAALEIQAFTNQIRADLGEATNQLDLQSRDVISPRLDEVEALTREMTTAEAAVQGLQQSIGRWADVDGLDETAGALDGQVAALNRRETELNLQLDEGRLGLVELSETFDELVRNLNLPWYETAHIDTDTYLPIVNGREFDQLSVGGARKTIVNLAYHLANLNYALANQAVAMPSLLIIDSPRKNVGNEREDKQVSEAIYGRLRALAESYPESVQIIVGDNDLPASARRWINEIPLSYDDPLVPGVVHPGESVETLASRQERSTD